MSILKEYLKQQKVTFSECPKDDYVFDMLKKVHNLETHRRSVHDYELSEIVIAYDKHGEYPEHYVMLLNGGKNGNGEWNRYFDRLAELSYSMEKIFGDMWVCTLVNDVPDDVHYVIVGFPRRNVIRIAKDAKEPNRVLAYAQPIPAV